MQFVTIEKELNTKIKDYISLLKPRVMVLVVFTGLVGLYLAPGDLHPLLKILAIFYIALGSGAAGAINMWYERDIDAKMTRTMNRPIPSGLIPAHLAFDFALICAGSAVFFMALTINYLAAFLLLIAILFYVFIYTIWLKPRTPQNIVIGGAAGALPPIIGWAAVTNNISIEPLILFLIIFIWTPPHFWALSLYRCKDYEKVGIPMLPNIVGRKKTITHIFIYSIILVITSLLPVFVNMSGLCYLLGALLLGAGFIYYAIKLLVTNSDIVAKKMFFYSIYYLFLLFLLLVIDHHVKASFYL
jgi:protoheme IX farnesyltransferase